LVQLDSDIHNGESKEGMFDSEQEIALGYLAHQFPEDYPEDKEEKPKVKGPSKEELDK